MVLLIVLVTAVPATIAVLVAMFALYRQLRSLLKAAARFNDELRPISIQLEAQVRDAQDHVEALPAKVPSWEAGARLPS
jgi:cytochrome c-type biogenesis protein CcmH/NrfG